ncbi:MAG: menaquinone biosynthesis protein [Ginsengibacter sp.]
MKFEINLIALILRKFKVIGLQTKIRVGAVSYLNTKPLIYGFENGMMKDEVDLIIDYPAKIGSLLLNNQIDVGLIPVAVIPLMKEYHIISDYCIGSVGEVASVCLFSEVPLQQIETILLDYQSRTSVALLKILIKEYWKLNVVFEETSGNYQTRIVGSTAGLVIGDRALMQRKVSAFTYDLGEEWKKFTGLPFVYAAWVSNKQLDDNFVQHFNKATRDGCAHIEEIVATNVFEDYDLNIYYTQNIDYLLDEAKRNALNLFLEYLAKQ